MRDAKIRQLGDLYEDIVARQVQWVVGREKIAGSFVNTKFDPVKMRDFSGSGEGRNTIYSWTQGRALESLVLLSRFFRDRDPERSKTLVKEARSLYFAVVDGLFAGGKAEFEYDISADTVEKVTAGQDGFGFSDIYIVKSLATGSMMFDLPRLGDWIRLLLDIRKSVEDGSFILNERQRAAPPLRNAMSNPCGPKIIIFGAVLPLLHLGWQEAASFGRPFIQDIMENYGRNEKNILYENLDRNAYSPGMTIQFCGVALEFARITADQSFLGRATDLLLGAFSGALTPHGVYPRISVQNGQPLDDYFYYWSLSEGIRALSCAYMLTGRDDILSLWFSVSDIFFRRYQVGELPLFYPTISRDGPVNFSPGVPDLDPGYHVGLCLASAVCAIEEIGEQEKVWVDGGGVSALPQ